MEGLLGTDRSSWRWSGGIGQRATSLYLITYNTTQKPGSKLLTHLLQNEVCGKIMVHPPCTSFKSVPISSYFWRVEPAEVQPSALEAYVLKNPVSENGHLEAL